MKFYSVHIKFVDGTEETIDRVNEHDTKNQVLSLYQIHDFSSLIDNLGSYPLSNIKKYTINER